MNNRANWIFAGLLLAVVAGAALWLPTVPGVAYRDKITEAAIAVATSLLVVTLFVERGMAAVNAIVWGEELRIAEIGLLADDDGTRAAAAAAMARVLTARERLRLLLSFASGLFISAGGIRTLEGLVDLGGKPGPALLIPVDVVLTAGLIAGGSNGLAFLIQILKDRLTNPPTGSRSLKSTLVTTG